MQSETVPATTSREPVCKRINSGQYQQERKHVSEKDGFQAHYLIGVYFDSFPLFEKRGFGGFDDQ